MWKSKGLVFAKHQAQLPTPLYVGNGIIRIYYSTRISGKSHIRFFDIRENTLELISEDREAMGPGERGMFDHAGVMPSCIIQRENDRPLMFYTGWYLRQDVPYGHAIGTAIILEDGTLKRQNQGPIFAQEIYSPCLVNSPFVECRKNKEWVMYFCSGSSWIENYPTYCIRKASSDFGLLWKSETEKFITYNLDDEAISRVWKDENNGFYYSYKTKDQPYRLAYYDGGHQKLDFEIPKSDWDCEMQCYPALYSREKYRYLFYNGNGYGSTGIGVAE